MSACYRFCLAFLLSTCKGICLGSDGFHTPMLEKLIYMTSHKLQSFSLKWNLITDTFGSVRMIQNCLIDRLKAEWSCSITFIFY